MSQSTFPRSLQDNSFQATWRLSPELIDRIALRPSQTDESRKYLVLRSDPEMNFARKQLLGKLPEGTQIRRLYYIDSPGTIKKIEGPLTPFICRFQFEFIQDGYKVPYSVSEAMESAEEGNLVQLQSWIDEDRSRLQAKNQDGETLLYSAFIGNQIPLMEWIYSLDPNQLGVVRADKKSIPFLAILEGKTKIFDWVLKKRFPYSSRRFIREAKELNYSTETISNALKRVGWSRWSIPRRDPYFVGREVALESLRMKLSENPSQVASRVAIIGATGIGKSSLAALYVHENQSRYSLVWWIRSGNSPELYLKDLAIQMGQASTVTAESLAVKNAFDYLNRNPGWLLVFDNAGPPSRLVPLLLKLDKGHVLITSSDCSWQNSLKVGTLSLDESITLLRKYKDVIEGSEEYQKLVSLAEELGGFPLAIRQSGSYISKNPISYSSYLDLYLEKRKNLVESKSLREESPYSVTTASKIILDMLERSSPDSFRSLLRALYLASDEIPESLLKEKGLSVSQVNGILEELEELCLMNRGLEEDTSLIHEQTQSCIKGGISADQQERTRKFVYACFQEIGFPFNRQDRESWKRGQLLLAHLEAFSSNIGGDEAKAFFFSTLGDYFRFTEPNPTKALDLSEKSIVLKKQLYGSSDKRLASSLKTLGVFYFEQRNFNKAIELFGECLPIFEGLYGKESSEVESILDLLSLASAENKDMLRSIVFAKRALALKRKIYGEKDRRVAQSMGRLADSYSQISHHFKAAIFYAQALSVLRTLHGQGHELVASTFQRLLRSVRLFGGWVWSLQWVPGASLIWKSQRPIES